MALSGLIKSASMRHEGSRRAPSTPRVQLRHQVFVPLRPRTWAGGAGAPSPEGGSCCAPRRPRLCPVRIAPAGQEFPNTALLFVFHTDSPQAIEAARETTTGAKSHIVEGQQLRVLQVLTLDEAVLVLPAQVAPPRPPASQLPPPPPPRLIRRQQKGPPPARGAQGRCWQL